MICGMTCWYNELYCLSAYPNSAPEAARTASEIPLPHLLPHLARVKKIKITTSPAQHTFRTTRICRRRGSTVPSPLSPSAALWNSTGRCLSCHHHSSTPLAHSMKTRHLCQPIHRAAEHPAAILRPECYAEECPPVGPPRPFAKSSALRYKTSAPARSCALSHRK